MPAADPKDAAAARCRGFQQTMSTSKLGNKANGLLLPRDGGGPIKIAKVTERLHSSGP